MKKRSAYGSENADLVHVVVLELVSRPLKPGGRDPVVALKATSGKQDYHLTSHSVLILTQTSPAISQ